MMDDVARHVRLLLTMGCSGVVLGILFDSIRIIRSILRPNKWFSAFLDLIFWACGTLIAAEALVIANHGELRIGAVVGLLLGLLFYYRLVSSFLISASARFIRSIGYISGSFAASVTNIINSGRAGIAAFIKKRI